MTYTSERRRTCWKLQVRAQSGVEQSGLWTWHARQLPFLPGHSNSIHTRNGRLFASARLFMPRTAPTYRWKTGNWIKFAAGAAAARKARSGISSGMIYLTRSVLIRAYYMRDRGPRRTAPQPSAVWPYASTYHLRPFGSTRPIVLAIVPFSHSVLSPHVYIEATIKFQKKRKSRENSTEKYFTYSFQIVLTFIVLNDSFYN